MLKVEIWHLNKMKLDINWIIIFKYLKVDRGW
jgi:hypothetical protein